MTESMKTAIVGAVTGIKTDIFSLSEDILPITLTIAGLFIVAGVVFKFVKRTSK